MNELFDNDKLLAMFCVTLIGCISMYYDKTSNSEIILPIVTGIFGIVTGSVLRK